MRGGHLQEIVADIVFEFHDIVHRLDASILAAVDHLSSKHVRNHLKDGTALRTYLGLEMRNLLERRVRLPHRLDTHL